MHLRYLINFLEHFFHDVKILQIVNVIPSDLSLSEAVFHSFEQVVHCSGKFRYKSSAEGETGKEMYPLR